MDILHVQCGYVFLGNNTEFYVIICKGIQMFMRDKDRIFFCCGTVSNQNSPAQYFSLNFDNKN